MSRRKVTSIATGKHLQLLDDNGWEYADRVRGSGVVAVVAVTVDGDFILTEQYRRPVNMKVVDLAAGLSGDIAGEEDEALETAARRELLEETGYDCKTMDFVFTGPSSAGMTTEMISFYVTRDAYYVNDGGGDESEDIKVHVIPMGKLNSWLKRKDTKRTCIDPKVYAALGILRQMTD